ncbi:hypothetical protein OIU78_010650 [Salix suchowensis]|nr:hypothetical protein OIU78_010650 [Salix suchowensis]
MDSALAFTAATLPLVTITKVNRHFITHDTRSPAVNAAVWNAFSSSAASFGTSSGGGGGGGEFGRGGGGGGSDGGDAESNSVAGAVDAEEVSLLSPDVIILDVGGMTCGGCAASVKRILESQPQVSSASVNLATETAIVWPVSEAKNVPNWQKHLGEALAKHLTSCGFMSNLRVAGQGATDGDISM